MVSLRTETATIWMAAGAQRPRPGESWVVLVRKSAYFLPSAPLFPTDHTGTNTDHQQEGNWKGPDHPLPSAPICLVTHTGAQGTVASAPGTAVGTSFSGPLGT